MNIQEIHCHLKTFKIKSLNLKPNDLEDFIKAYFKTFDKDSIIIKLKTKDNCESHQGRNLSLVIILYSTNYSTWICNEFIKMLMTSEMYKLNLYKYSCKYNSISYNDTFKINGDFS